MHGPTSPEVLEFEESAGKSWNFAEILEKSWKSPRISLL